MYGCVLQFPTMSTTGPRLPILRPNRITELRKALGVTMQQLAVSANITRGHLGNLERGERELTKPVMERLAEHLGCMPADLLNPEDGGLSPQERHLIDTYRDVPESLRGTWRAVAESQQAFRGGPEVVPLDAEGRKRA